jgi:phosphatidate phosphatase APP1
MLTNPDYSDIKSDETVVFFRTSAWLGEAGKVWNIPIHGWIYEPQNSTVRKAIAEEILEQKYDLTVDKTSKDNFDRRINLIIADNERGKRIIVRIGQQTFPLPQSKENGQFTDIIQLPVKTVDNLKQDNVLRFTTVMDPDDSRRYAGEVILVPPDGISVISDIDDTVKISEVTDHKKLLNNTFYRDFQAVPGMADLYVSWARKKVAFHFVSSSPWQLYPPLNEFMDQNNFPKATFSLKDFRFRDETFFNLFKKGTETKPAQIEPILQRYPGRKFVLVGDSGEQDPEVYASIARKYPDQIARIYIRNVNGATASDQRFKNAFDGLDNSLWQLFADPSGLGLP